MWKKILISGAVGAVILGAGGTALAASGNSSSPTPPGAATTGPSTHSAHAKAKGKSKAGDELRRALHGTWVTKGKDGKPVTHDAIRGTVSAVSSTSITVTAADATSETYTVNSWTTKVRDDKKPSVISAVAVKDVVAVLGTGTGTNLTATHIVDRGTAPTPKS